MISGKVEYVLDASALLAVMLNEPGYDRVRAVMDRCLVHSVNVAEVISKLVREGVPKNEALASVEELSLTIQEKLPLRMAADCGELIALTRKQGLALGDCVGLTAAAHARATAVTAERLWKKIEGRRMAGSVIKVQLVR